MDLGGQATFCGGHKKFDLILLVVRSWTAENQSLGSLSKQQNLQQEHCIEG